MFRLMKALGIVKLTAVVAVLATVSAAAAVPATLPSQASDGQERAAAGAANGQAASERGNGPDAEAAPEVVTEAVTEQLTENQERLLGHLNDVLEQLAASDADQHAVDALEAVIDRLTNENIGLNRAAEAISSGGSGNSDAPADVELPAAATDHPTADDHPGRP